MMTTLLLWLASLTAPPVPQVDVLPLWGGDVRALAVHPEDPNLLAAGTTAGQIYLSRDGGHSWADAGSPVPFPGWVVSTLRFDPGQPRRLWAGLWGLWGSGLVAVSEDLGAGWHARMGAGSGERGRLPGEPVYDLALIPPREAGGTPRILAGTLNGVWASDDDGHSWRHLSAGSPEIHHVSSLWVDSTDPGTLLAGTWRRAYKSEDGGATWRGVFTGMQLDSEVFTLSSAPGDPRELWAATCGWVYRSRDGGESWRRFRHGLPERRTPSFAVLPDGRLLAGTIAGLWISRDDGHTWRRHTPEDLAVRVIARDPRRPERILLGTEGAGIWRSDDGGSTFAPSHRGLANLRVSAVLSRSPRGGGAGEVWVAIHHAGPLSGLWRSSDEGRSFEQVASRLPPVLALEDTAEGLVAHTEDGPFGAATAGEPWRPLVLPREPGERPPAGSSPVAGGRRLEVADGELAWGRREVWFRPRGEGEAGDVRDAAAASAWERLPVAAVRVIETGDPAWPVLVVETVGVRPWDARRQSLGNPLEVPVPAHLVMTAARVGDRWWLGTSGFGVLAVGPATPVWPPAPPVAARPVAR